MMFLVMGEVLNIDNVVHFPFFWEWRECVKWHRNRKIYLETQRREPEKAVLHEERGKEKRGTEIERF